MSAPDTSFEDGVFRLTMKGPGVFNPESLAAFNSALDTALSHEAAEVLLLTGQDKNFSQGLDLEYLMAVSDPAEGLNFVGDCMRMVGRLLCFPLPVVSALNGHAFGLGAMITLASDYKAMREDRGYFCLPEVDLGMTLTERMNALVCGKLSGTVLRDVLLTGKQLAADEALAAGIVDTTASLDVLVATAIELAAPMRGKKRESVAGLKRGINVDILDVIEADVPDVVIESQQ